METYDKHYNKDIDKLTEDAAVYFGEEPEKNKIKTTLPKINTKNKTVLILCSGLKHCWEVTPRQFWPIKDESVLSRLIRQVEDNNLTPVIVTWRKDICEYVIENKVISIYKPECYRSIAETWLFTKDIWKEQTVILLGDTVFSDDAIKEVLEYNGSMRMFGNSSELFSFSFCSNDHNKITDILFKVNRNTWKAAPWFIYRLWCGFPLEGPDRENKVFSRIDHAADIDHPKEYEAVVKMFDRK